MVHLKSVRFLLLLLFIFMAGVVQAQESNEWTLQECVDYAIKNNIQVKQSGLDVQASQVELQRSKADLFPTLNGQTEFSYSLGRSIEPSSNLIIDESFRAQTMSIGSNVTIFNGFQKQNTIKKSKVDEQVSNMNYEVTKNDVILNVVGAYTTILFNQELLANARLRVETTLLQVERTEKLVNAGTLARSSLLELQAQQATDELAVVNAENQLETSRLNLRQLMQLPWDQNIEIVVPEFPDPDEVIYAESVGDIYKAAVLTQPIIKSTELQVESAEYNVQIAKGNRYPSITGSAYVGSRYSSALKFLPDPLPGDPNNVKESTYMDQLDFNLNRGLAIGVNIPIFNGWQVKSAVSNAKINYESAKLNAINAKNELRQIIEQAYLDVVSAAKSYAASKEQVRSLQEAFRSNETRFNLGAINAVEYNLTKQNLDVAESDLIRAKYDYILKTKLLDFYQGKTIELLNN